MPLRKSSLAPGAADECRRRLGLDPSCPTLLVTGASQGSESINDFTAEFIARCPDALNGWQVYHLTGPGRGSSLAEMYERVGVRAVVEPFQSTMGLAWGAADLAISRAGANSVAEIGANAVPAIFLPYPHHRDRHQFDNARPLAEVDAAVILEDHIDPRINCEIHGRTVASLLADGARRQAMREILRANRPANGSETLANLLIETMSATA